MHDDSDESDFEPDDELQYQSIHTKKWCVFLAQKAVLNGCPRF